MQRHVASELRTIATNVRLMFLPYQPNIAVAIGNFFLYIVIRPGSLICWDEGIQR